MNYPPYFAPRKRFGQHFLTDQAILHDIISAIQIEKNDDMVEIGPGKGILTQQLINCAPKHLDIIEIDRDLAAFLQEKFSSIHFLTIHNKNILEFDWQPLLAEHQWIRIVGNLPYNITTPLLFQLFELGRQVQDMHFLLQKEVVERLTAPVGSHNYSRLSVMAQYFANLESLFNVSHTAFSPPPKVESAFIRIIPFKTPPFPAKDLTLFSAIVKEAFTYRRKTLANSLHRLVPVNILTSLNIDPHLRPQQLTVENFVKISNNVPVIIPREKNFYFKK